MVTYSRSIVNFVTATDVTKDRLGRKKESVSVRMSVVRRETKGRIEIFYNIECFVHKNTTVHNNHYVRMSVKRSLWPLNLKIHIRTENLVK